MFYYFRIASFFSVRVSRPHAAKSVPGLMANLRNKAKVRAFASFDVVLISFSRKQEAHKAYNLAKSLRPKGFVFVRVISNERV